jgi:hypothetical protein
MKTGLQLRLESMLAEALAPVTPIRVQVRKLVKRVQRFAVLQFEMLFPEKKPESLEERYLREYQPGKFRWEYRAIKGQFVQHKPGKRGSPKAMRKFKKDDPYLSGI